MKSRRQLKSVEAWMLGAERPTTMPKVCAKEDHAASTHNQLPVVHGPKRKRRTHSPNRTAGG